MAGGDSAGLLAVKQYLFLNMTAHHCTHALLASVTLCTRSTKVLLCMGDKDHQVSLLSKELLAIDGSWR